MCTHNHRHTHMHSHAQRQTDCMTLDSGHSVHLNWNPHLGPALNPGISNTDYWEWEAGTKHLPVVVTTSHMLGILYECKTQSHHISTSSMLISSCRRGINQRAWTEVLEVWIQDTMKIWCVGPTLRYHMCAWHLRCLTSLLRSPMIIMICISVYDDYAIMITHIWMWFWYYSPSSIILLDWFGKVCSIIHLSGALSNLHFWNTLAPQTSVVPTCCNADRPI